MTARLTAAMIIRTNIVMVPVVPVEPTVAEPPQLIQVIIMAGDTAVINRFAGRI